MKASNSQPMLAAKLLLASWNHSRSAATASLLEGLQALIKSTARAAFLTAFCDVFLDLWSSDAFLKSACVKHAGIAIRHSQGYTGILQSLENSMDRRGWTSVEDTRKRQLS